MKAKIKVEKDTLQSCDLFWLSTYGWRDGASARPMDPQFLNDDRPEVADAYSVAYAAGRISKQRAVRSFAKRFGVTNHQIQAAVLRHAHNA